MKKASRYANNSFLCCALNNKKDRNKFDTSAQKFALAVSHVKMSLIYRDNIFTFLSDAGRYRRALQRL